jgi:AraC-like DNA-binding protein
MIRARNKESIEPLCNYRLFETCDLDESRDVMGRLWEKHVVECVGRTDFRTRVNHVQIGQIGLSFVDCATPLRIEAFPSGDDYYIQFPVNCSSEFRVPGETLIANPDQGVMMCPDRELRIATPPARVFALQIPTRLVPSFQALGTPDNNQASASPGVLDLRLPAVRWCASELNEHPTLLGSSATPHLEALLRSRFIASLPESNLSSRNGQPALSPAKLQEIENWIYANLEQPINVLSLAQQFGTSVRSLQVAFRSRRDCTPMDFVRTARLWAVRSELRQSAPTAQQLRFVASKFGLLHPGRFAAHYRKIFGELPSETIAKNLQNKGA